MWSTWHEDCSLDSRRRQRHCDQVTPGVTRDDSVWAAINQTSEKNRLSSIRQLWKACCFFAIRYMLACIKTIDWFRTGLVLNVSMLYSMTI